MDLARLTIVLLVLFTLPACGAEALQNKAEEAEAKKEAFVIGEDGWRFLPAELKFAAKLASPDLANLTKTAVEAIADFAGQMKAAEVTLIVLPVPPKVLLAGAAAGVTAEEQTKMRAGWESIMRELTDREVTVVDLLADYSSATHEPFCRRDTHWSGRGIALAVDRLLPLLEGAGMADHEAPGVGDAWTKQTLNGDLGGDPEEIELRGQRLPAEPEAIKKNPVLLLGDSHVLVFHQGGDLHTTGAGLPDQVAAALGSMPDVLGVRGSGATSSRVQLARRARADENYIPSKKVIVWCFAGREFTEADSWKKVPILKTSVSN
jgi:alginate O-acetyltransferase complex protein AlgJ